MMPPVATIRTRDRYVVNNAPAEQLPSLLDGITVSISSRSDNPQESQRLDRFLAARTVKESMEAWFGVVPDLADQNSRNRVSIRLNFATAQIDQLISEQLHQILHHPELQKLEASWRGLKYLVDQVPDGANIKIRALQASWKDLVKDQERALEFDQSQLFRKVYSDEFGTPGGEPYGLLIGNYDVCHRPYEDHQTDDIRALSGLANVAAAAFAPLIMGVDPRFFELDSFAELDPTIDLERTFARTEYVKWNALRSQEDSRFLGLVIPKVVLRKPYDDHPSDSSRFHYREDVSAGDRTGYLWGNGAFAFAGVAIRTFSESNWLAEIRGTRETIESSGMITGLPDLQSGPSGIKVPQSVTNIQITDMQERELGDLGFMPMCHLPGSNAAAFYTVPSIQKAKVYDDESATANARLSSMLQYILCVSRFAHYLKVIMRDRVGSFTTAEEMQEMLQKWLSRFVVGNESASVEMKAKHPLREAKVEIREIEDKPGSYRCVIYLRPHFQLDQLSAGIRLTTQLGGQGAQ